jgi:protein SCO1/2
MALHVGRGRAALMVVCGLLLAAAAWIALRHRLGPTDSNLPVLGTVPDFSLTASTGGTVTQADLTGGLWVADFIFTKCPSVCPLLSAQMGKLQDALAAAGRADVHLVSFSVDPANDTPEVLRAYAQRFHADPARWWFLTGDQASLHALIRNGFRLAVAERSPGEDTDGGGLITHSDRFVLVDRNLHIRGYYHGADTETVQKLLRDIRTLSSTSS